MSPSRLPVLYDADCRFCRVSVAALLSADRNCVLEPVALQSDRGALLLASVPEPDRLATAHCVLPDGTIRSGGAAFAPVATAIGRFKLAARAARRFPRAVEAAYGLVADNRSRLSWVASPARLARADAAIAARAERNKRSSS